MARVTCAGKIRCTRCTKTKSTCALLLSVRSFSETITVSRFGDSREIPRVITHVLFSEATKRHSIASLERTKYTGIRTTVFERRRSIGKFVRRRRRVNHPTPFSHGNVRESDTDVRNRIVPLSFLFLRKVFTGLSGRPASTSYPIS